MCRGRLPGALVEVGAAERHWAPELLELLPRSFVYSIDVGEYYESLRTERACRYDVRSIVMPCSSLAAAAQFCPESLRCVAIHLQGSCEQIGQELAAWWPALAPAGVLAVSAGRVEPETAERAFSEFAARHSQPVLHPRRRADCCWYTIKKKAAAGLQ